MDPIREAIVREFQSAEKVAFLATLMRTAHADDVSPSERDLLQPVAEWVGASPEEQSLALQRAYDPAISLVDLVGALRRGDCGLLLFRECCGVVWVDGRKTQAETQIMEELARILGVSDGVRAILDSPLACSPEGERRFLVLIGGDSSE